MSRIMTRRVLTGAAAGSVLLSAVAGVTPALAQIEEIVVTSQKREQSIQSIPIAVTAFDASALEMKQIETFSDLQFNTPNVNFTAGNFGGSNFQIRGIGSASIGSSGDGGVGIHINDAPIRSPALLSTEYYDIERLEVARGPQGTLFGRNATGGAINLITAKPDLDGFSGQVNASVGEYSSTKISGMVNVPLTDTLGVRVAGLVLNRDGYTENTFTGEDVDGRDQYSWRASARWTPGERTTIDFMYSYFEEDSNRSRKTKQLCNRDDTGVVGCLPDKLDFEAPNANSFLSTMWTSAELYNFFSPALVPFAWSSIAGPGDGYDTAIIPTDMRTIHSPGGSYYYNEEKLWTLSLEHEFDNHTLTIVYSDREGDAYNGSTYNQANANPVSIFAGVDIPTFFGIAGAPYNLAIPYYTGGIPTSLPTKDGTGILSGNYYQSATPQGDDYGWGIGSQWTLEGRVRSDLDGPVNYLLGGFAMHTEGESGYMVMSSGLDYASFVLGPVFFGAVPGAPYFGWSPHYLNITPKNELDSWAAFGEMYFNVGDDVKITGGLRYNNDEKVNNGRTTLIADGIVAPAGAVQDPDLWDPAALTIFKPFNNRTGEWKESTGRLLIEWTPDLSGTDSTLIYGSFSRGYKGGGFNPDSTTGAFPDEFAPEFINAYEIGMKNTMWNNTLTANLTGFMYDYEGYQISKIVDRTSINENIDATIWGLEGEFLYAPSEKWLSNLTLSYLNTEIGNSESVDPRDPSGGEANKILIKDLIGASHCVLDTGIEDPALVAAAINGFDSTALPNIAGPIGGGIAAIGAHGVCDAVEAIAAGLDGIAWVSTGEVNMLTDGVAASLKGNQLPLSPEWSLNFGTQRTFYMKNGMSLAARLDYFVQAEMYTRIFNRPIDKVGSWDQLNLSATLSPEEGDWALKLFVQNVMDDDNTTGHYLTDATSGNWTNVFVLEPRIIGVSFDAKF